MCFFFLREKKLQSIFAVIGPFQAVRQPLIVTAATSSAVSRVNSVTAQLCKIRHHYFKLNHIYKKKIWARYLGEVINERGERWEIQFKGAGLTPYSRTADGRKVLRSSLREFLCSEAMHFLGVATTRAGTCVVSEDKVVRDIFYDGHPRLEKCSVILRIAPTFFRFGSFEIFLPVDRQTGGRGPSYGNNELLIKMLDYVSNTFFGNVLVQIDGIILNL